MSHLKTILVIDQIVSISMSSMVMNAMELSFLFYNRSNYPEIHSVSFKKCTKHHDNRYFFVTFKTLKVFVY